MAAEITVGPVTVGPVDPEARNRRRESREAAAVRRERIIETARLLRNRALLSGRHTTAGYFGWGTGYVMRPETLDFLRRGSGWHFEGSPKLKTGDTPLFDGLPVHFSEELELDQVIFVFEGWPYLDED